MSHPLAGTSNPEVVASLFETGYENAGDKAPTIESFPQSQFLVAAVQSYFQHFHPSLPLVHTQTFVASKYPLLTMRLAAIGAIYLRTEDATRTADLLNLKSHNHQRLHWNTLAKTRASALALFQGAVLGIIYGLLTGNVADIERSRTFARPVMSLASAFGLFNGASVFKEDSTLSEFESWAIAESEKRSVSISRLPVCD